MNAPTHPPRRVSALRLPLRPLTLLLAGMASLGALGLFAPRSQAADAPAATPAAKPALTVSLSQPQTTMVPIKLAANGSVAAWQEASVGAEAAGLRVLELKAQVGDHVKRGQLLATFAAETVQADVALARAGLSEAQANAAEATANAERARVVQNTGALSAQQISQYLTAELTARARVESAKAQLDAQLLRLKQTQLLAPDSGIITLRNATVGSVVGAGTEMFRLIRQGRLEWRGEVTAAELGRITAGMVVVLSAPGGAQVKGRVRMVSPTVDPATRNGLVYVDLGSAVREATSVGATFKPGMFARGEFGLGGSNALTVPQSAVVVRDGFSYVYRVGADSKVKQLKVQTGRVMGDQVEVLDGVQAQDKLVASGGSFLSDGDLVKVVDAAPKQAVVPANAAQPATK